MEIPIPVMKLMMERAKNENKNLEIDVNAAHFMRLPWKEKQNFDTYD